MIYKDDDARTRDEGENEDVMHAGEPSGEFDEEEDEGFSDQSVEEYE